MDLVNRLEVCLGDWRLVFARKINLNHCQGTTFSNTKSERSLQSETCGCVQGRLHQKWQPEDLDRVMQILCSSGCSRTLHFHAAGDAAVMQAVQSCDRILCSSSISCEFGTRCAPALCDFLAICFCLKLLLVL
jgi:hypothetical protein